MKLKAWDSNDKIMYDVFGIRWDDTNRGHQERILINHRNGFLWFFVKPYFVIRKPIGIVDKKGKDIYEGDLLIRFRHEEIKTVEYICGDEEDFQGYDIEQVFGKWTIIGNIYQNPKNI